VLFPRCYYLRWCVCSAGKEWTLITMYIHVHGTSCLTYVPISPSCLSPFGVSSGPALVWKYDRRLGGIRTAHTVQWHRRVHTCCAGIQTLLLPIFAFCDGCIQTSNFRFERVSIRLTRSNRGTTAPRSKTCRMPLPSARAVPVYVCVCVCVSLSLSPCPFSIGTQRTIEQGN
jgi:hypothetical protein